MSGIKVFKRLAVTPVEAMDRMAESEAILSVMSQAVIQAATAAAMAMREVDVGSISGANLASPREAHSQRHGGLALKQLSFN